MKKRFLTSMNVVLGTLSVALAGCGSAKKAVSSPVEEAPAKKYGPPHEEIVEKYGIPPYLLEEPEEEGTPAPDKNSSSKKIAPVFQEPEPPSTLYGPPPGWDEK